MHAAALSRRRSDPVSLRPGVPFRAIVLKDALDHCVAWAVLRSQLAAHRTYVHEYVHLALFGELLLQKSCCDRLGASTRMQLARYGTNLNVHQSGRSHKVWPWCICQGALHKVVPDRSRPLRTGQPICFSIVIVSDPDAGYQVRRVADGPTISIVVRRSCLGSSREREFEIAVGAKGWRACSVVGEDIADPIGMTRVHDAGEGRLRVGDDHVSLLIGDIEDRSRLHTIALVREGGIGACHLEQRDFAASQGE